MDWTDPPAWHDHLLNLLKRDKEEDKVGVEANPPLDYDEAPAQHREPMPFGFIQSELQLGSVEGDGWLAIMADWLKGRISKVFKAYIYALQSSYKIPVLRYGETIFLECKLL